MKKSIVTLSLLGLSLLSLQAQQPDPKEFLESALGTPKRANVGYGEQFCWYVNFSADYFVEGYEAYGDPEWIQAGQDYFDWAVSKMQKDPDGFPGWIGPPIGEEKKADLKYHTDTVVGDSIVMVAMLGWAETVLNDPALKSRFGKKAQEYVELAETVLWKKFNSRGQFYTDAAGWVSYPTHNKMVRVSDGKWEDFPDRVISNNLNKHYDLAHGLLRLYRITGKEEYKDRARAVFGRAKSMFRYYKDGDRIVWNFWMPHAPYDIEGQSPKSWVSVHPSRSGYQASEVTMFVEAYDTGIVFTEEDMERIGRTNQWMGEHNWVNAEGGKAGQLWGGITRFNEWVKNAYENQIAKAKDDRAIIARDYYNKVVKKEGEGRLYRQPAPGDLVDVPLKDGDDIIMSVVIPNKLELVNNDRVQLATKTRTDGNLVIEFMDKDASTSYGVIYENKHSNGGQFDSPLWDGTVPGKGKPQPGQYTIRWTFNDEVRTEPIWIVQGEKRAATTANVIQPGQTWTEDFEGKLSNLWNGKDMAPSSEQAHSGSKSLKVPMQAEFVFGEDKRDDLPVKISFWVYDSGAKNGKKNGDGPMWGIQTTLGDKFVFRQVWRGYLSGDDRYNWINTAENNFFSAHPSASRKTGWSNWVFDFSTSPATISMDGQPIAGIDSKWLPSGAVKIFLENGSPGGPLYVDDVEVTYPAQ